MVALAVAGLLAVEVVALAVAVELAALAAAAVALAVGVADSHLAHHLLAIRVRDRGWDTIWSIFFLSLHHDHCLSHGLSQ